uniref:Transmembrane protein 119 n=1 Tax=Bursaphelenchus xylophilus TaxID=6326 RepID=A0A1I7S7J7_BURXY
MDSHRIWWLFLWLCPFFLRFGHSISEFEVDPEILCGEGCKAIENGDFNEFWCVYKARSSKDFVYAGICNYILLFVLIAMGVLSVALPVAVKLFFCIRNCRRLRGAYKQPQAISPVTPRVYRPEPSKVQVVEAKEGDKQSDKQYESVQGTASGVTEQQQQVTNLDSVPLAGPTGTEKKEEK